MGEQQIEGIPAGWRLVRIGSPKAGEWFIDSCNGTPLETSWDWRGSVRVIIEKIEQPKQYRPFANAKEFEPHRDRWFNLKTDPGQVQKTTAYNEREVWIDDEFITWQRMFELYTFESGTSFGVEVTE